jgi:acid phosphatase (class A)
MGQLGKSNLNLNLNLNLSAANPAANGGSGTRINTQEFRKVANTNVFPFPSGSATAIGPLGPGQGQRIKYREFWDGDLQAYVYLNEFVTQHPDWFKKISGIARPIKDQLEKNIDQELVRVVDAAPERESRFAEIIQQHTAEGAISYWEGMLMLEPSYAPATCLLIRSARRIGEHVGMCLKNEFRFPRPSQLCPAVVPMIDPPAHPSFPSGHALQGRLISLVLKDVRGALPQANELLDELAERVALNRIIAGLHYPLDNKAGVEAANEIHQMLKDGLAFNELVSKAKDELYK